MRKAGPARQVLGKFLTEEKSSLKTKLLQGSTKPISALDNEVFCPLYQNSDVRLQRNMRLAAAKWVHASPAPPPDYAVDGAMANQWLWFKKRAVFHEVNKLTPKPTRENFWNAVFRCMEDIFPEETPEKSLE